MEKLEINSFVVFDLSSVSNAIYKSHYEELFPKGKLFIYLGEVKQMKGHCLLCDLDTGRITGLYHSENFREATEEEC